MNDETPLVEGARIVKAIALIESYIAVKALNTQKAYRAVYTEWLSWCEGTCWVLPKRKFLRATKGDALDYLAHLRLKPGVPSRDGRSRVATERTAVRKIEILRGMYRWLIENGHFTGLNPFEFPLPRRPVGSFKRPTRALTDEQVCRVLNAFPGHDYEAVMWTAMLHLMFGLGLRRGEVCNLRMADVLTETKEIVIAVQKNKNVDVMLCPEWVWEALERYLIFRQEAQSSDSLFWKLDGPHCHRSPGIGDGVVKRVFKRALIRAGLPPDQYSPHSARATAITKQFDRGLTTREVQPFARHSTGAMTESYDKRRTLASRTIAAGISYKKSA